MPEWLREWWPAIAVALTLVVAPFVRWAARHGLVSREDLDAAIGAERKLRQEEIAAAAARYAAVEGRLVEIEAEIRHLPTREDIARIMELLSGLTAQQAATQATLDAIKALVTSVDATVRTHQSLFTEAARR